MSKIYYGVAHMIAEDFHDAYEELAPQFGYETRQDTRIFDSNSNNGKLMIATVQKLIDDGKIEVPFPRSKN